MTTIYSVAMATRLHEQATIHLLRPDGQEDLCFGLWHPSAGNARETALISDLILPGPEDRRVHGNASFMPRYFERSLGLAVQNRAGLALLHSHPGGLGWQDMSADDINAERGHAAPTMAATGRALLGLTLSGDGAWSARFWPKVAPRRYERRPCATVRVVGDAFQITFDPSPAPPPRTNREEWRRSVAAWGSRIQAILARLHVGIVGAGSVGNLVGEALARTGFGRVSVLDFDTVELLNLDRLLHASRFDALCHQSKASVLVRAMGRSATHERFAAIAVEHGVTEEEGYRAALDCDILISCVDRPWPRSVLNFISYGHLIPVVDGGIRAEVTRKGELKRADWRAHVSAPGRPCMECLGQYDPGLVAVERDGYLDDPEYVRGLPKDHVLRRRENVFAFSASAASFQVLQMLMMIVAPMGVASPGAQMYHFVPGLLDEPRFTPCEPACPYGAMTPVGADSPLRVTGRHAAAEAARARRRAAQRQLPFYLKLADRLSKFDLWLEEKLASRSSSAGEG